MQLSTCVKKQLIVFMEATAVRYNSTSINAYVASSGNQDTRHTELQETEGDVSQAERWHVVAHVHRGRVVVDGPSRSAYVSDNSELSNMRRATTSSKRSLVEGNNTS
jgi:hypothetical protein